MSGLWTTSLAAGLAAVLLAGPADAQQGNLDAGKTPAQIFADTCSACHRRPQELKRASTSFLRSHYSTGSEEAAAMASYLAGILSEPRGAQQRRQGAAKEAPANETASRRHSEQKEQREQSKSAKGPAGSSKGRRAANAEAKAAAPAAPPEVKPPDASPSPESPRPPTLEPFEE